MSDSYIAKYYQHSSSAIFKNSVDVFLYMHMLNKNSLGLLKKGAAKQSRIKSIAWHLRWLVRTRADISLWPSGLVRPRTDIKLRPRAFVRTRTDFKLQTVGLGRSYKD